MVDAERQPTPSVWPLQRPISTPVGRSMIMAMGSAAPTTAKAPERAHAAEVRPALATGSVHSHLPELEFQHRAAGGGGSVTECFEGCMERAPNRRRQSPRSGTSGRHVPWWWPLPRLRPWLVSAQVSIHIGYQYDISTQPRIKTHVWPKNWCRSWAVRRFHMRMMPSSAPVMSCVSCAEKQTARV